jgi:rSAM/selenodomain-associated transferase 1
VSNLGRLVVMAKNPRPGEVKTRLIPALGDEGACTLYRAMLEDVVVSMAAGPWSTYVAVAPPEAKDELRSFFPSKVNVIPQTGNDLTERMIGVFDHLLEQQEPVVMRNSDSPDLPNALVQSAFDSLAQDQVDVVFGPDCGGGYYLVGLKEPCPDLFRTAMSTSDNFERTLERCQALSLRVAVLPPHADIDMPDDLTDLVARSAEIAFTCPQTHRALRSLKLIP